MMRAEITGEQRVRAALERFPAELISALQRGVGRALLLIQTRTKESKLSGQVLNVRTGRLRRSIATRMDPVTGDGKVSGVVGTKVVYAGAHEFGFHGTVSVREHLRRSKLGKPFYVSAHSRTMHLPERSFLRSSFRELQPQIRDEIAKEVANAVRAF